MIQVMGHWPRRVTEDPERRRKLGLVKLIALWYRNYLVIVICQKSDVLTEIPTAISS